MKTTKRFILGLISSLLFAAGLTRAADRIDPLNTQLSATGSTIVGTAPDCSNECDIASDIR